MTAPLPLDPTRQRQAAIASHILMAAALLLVMWQGLLPGLLCVCIGFLATRWLSPRLGMLIRTPTRQTPGLAGTAVVLLPILLLAFALPQTRGLIIDAPGQYRELLALMAKTVLDLREKLPPDLATQLPEETEEIQRAIAFYLVSKAGALATAGRAWLGGLLLAFIGLIIGVLAAARPSAFPKLPLGIELHKRVSHFGEVFRNIVLAQFWIALFNTGLTSLFLLVVLPLWDVRLPYTTALILLTFVAGLIPIVGNLICNGVLTLVGLSVSPLVALACLVFLVSIHKAEYFINAKVIGQRIHMNVWELLSAMFVMEALFGPAGLVAAPLFYAYTKQELQASNWV